MTRLQSLIKEVLSQPKKKDCNCGCNDCGGKAPILTEGKVKHLISEGLQYHMDKKIQLHESVYRIGSEKHFELIREARVLWVRGIINVSEDDQAILETNLGHFGMYEGEEVPLDMPMVNEEKEYYVTYNKGRGQGKGLVKSKESNYEEPRVFSKEEAEEYIKRAENRAGQMTAYFVSDKDMNRLEESKKKKKKDPPIGKPKRGGPKAYYVYVRDPKTKRIKKVTFGSGGLRAKIRNPKARNAFAKRHRCSEKNDRTKASYWSCRLPRYAKQLGLGSNMNTFW
jgi:hypothetical protein